MAETPGAGTSRRIVVKIGTNTLAGEGGTPDPVFLAGIAAEVVELRKRGIAIIIVSSGAIGAGRALLGFEERPRDIKLRQACAAVGQPRLMQAWEAAFAAHDLRVAQLLLTYHTFTSRSSFLNLRNATQALLDLGAVPIVNENDTVSIDEIDASFGDNDRLSALVAAKVQADLLIILSDVAGLYTKPPGERGAQLVPVVEAVTPEVYAMAGTKPGSSLGRGGMTSKLDAARLATRAGVTVVIAKGREPRALARILDAEPLGTRFLPVGRERAKNRWLTIAQPAGRIEVDAGAAAALRRGKHLLPAGVSRVTGTFPAGSVVDIAHEGRTVAKALSLLSSRDVDLVRGKHSDEANRILGRAGPCNVTRKNGLALVD